MPTITNYPGKVQPSLAMDILYAAYTRAFGSDQVVFVTATCSYSEGPYTLWFQGNGDYSWTLMEKAPEIFYPLTNYHIASTTFGQPSLVVPTSVTIIDGFGSHSVPVTSG